VPPRFLAFSKVSPLISKPAVSPSPVMFQGSESQCCPPKFVLIEIFRSALIRLQPSAYSLLCFSRERSNFLLTPKNLSSICLSIVTAVSRMLSITPRLSKSSKVLFQIKYFFLPVVNLIHSFAHQTFEFPFFFLPIIMIIHTTFDFREHHLYFFILFLETLKLYWVFGQIFISL
jgi:hypothetical protein